MNYHFYESKIIYILVAALFVIQFGSYFALRANNQHVVETTIHDELNTSTNVFHRLLNIRDRQLSQATQLLVADYGFRESIATKDKSTIESMLINHGKRVDAALLILTNSNQDIIATIPPSVETQSLKASQVFLMPETMHENMQDSDIEIAAINLTQHSTNANASLNTALFQVISEPISTPLPIAKLTVGYPINNNFAKDLSHLTDTDFIFFSKHGSQWKLQASSLASDIAQQLKPNIFNASELNLLKNKTSIYKEITVNSASYLAMPIVLSQIKNHEIIVIAAKPTHKVMFNFKKIEQMFVQLLVVTLLFSVAAIYFVTRRMIRPLNDSAHFDNLTGLGNRKLFHSIIDKYVINLKSNNKPFALMYLDLNEFKKINDTKGHEAGDAVLQATATRLKDVMRNTDNIIRLGGDEFALIVPDGSRKALQIIAEKIALAIAQPIKHQDTSISISVSIGVALAPLDADCKFDLLKKADEAMYIAKKTHVTYFFFGDTQY